MTDLQALKRESDAQVVHQFNGRDVTRGELSKLFDRVANKANWKFAINATAWLTDDEVELLREAVIFFTGSVPTIERVFKMTFIGHANQYHVTAAGYYATCGA